MIGIVDCNNFYASCERVFRPELNHKPIAVLSNNDGCIIARSQEVKDLKIPMAAPLFKWRAEIEKHNVELCSANFVLYGDLSERVMQIVKQEFPHVEVYSIDEAFFDLSGIPVGQAMEICRLLKCKIQQWLGLPVSIGIAPNKTLAKLANSYAKKNDDCNGVYYLHSLEQSPEIANMPVQEVWGVGRKIALSLESTKVLSINSLKDTEVSYIRRKYSVELERTVRELRGEYCYQLDTKNEYKQNICVSRSFGKKVSTYEGLRAALVNFTSIAAEKLRTQNCWARSITVFVHTNPFKANEEQYRASINIPLHSPSQESQALIKAAINGLKTIYKLNTVYKKAGVVINDIVPKQILQMSLFDEPGEPGKSATENKASGLSSLLDDINNKYPVNRESRTAIQYAAVSANSDWRMNQNYRSDRYTTSWSELKRVQ